jgi:hypothetical protein
MPVIAGVIRNNGTQQRFQRAEQRERHRGQ